MGATMLASMISALVAKSPESDKRLAKRNHSWFFGATLFMNSAIAITSPAIGVALLVVFVVAGKVFRDNWKQQGPNWKRNCWIAGVVAASCFAVLAFIPFMPTA